MVFFKGEGGQVRIHEDCVDKAPQGVEHECRLQAEWGKCSEPWMMDEEKESGRPHGYCEMSCNRCVCSGISCTKEISVGDVELSEGEVTVHVLSAALDPPQKFGIPKPKPPAPPAAPVRPPIYVWNPQTHRQEIMAVWNATIGAYGPPSPALTREYNRNSGPDYSYTYEWNATSGEYEYIMVRRQGN